MTAFVRGHGYDSGNLGGEGDPLIVLTSTWNFTGFPVVALPAGLGSRSGLPVGVSLVGLPDAEPVLVQAAIDLQGHELPPLRLPAGHDDPRRQALTARGGRLRGREQLLARGGARPTSSASAPSIRTSSATTSPERRARATVVRAGSASLSFAIEKWRAASEAICGRWVMQRT